MADLPMCTPEDRNCMWDSTRDYFLTLLKMELASMTPQQRKRLRRRYPIIAISLTRLSMD